MTDKKLTIESVPTNIITGFLGVGKTSAILNLLRNKPNNERWAVLVNEFGEIGVDGSLMKGEFPPEREVYISEVPGGCMCCAAGVPMQIALNKLLLKAKPDRLLIEPTGLGHPKEVLNVLKSPHYQEALLLQKTLTLVDARNLADTRYTGHDTFNQQITIADTVIGNKADLYQTSDKERLRHYVKQHGKANAHIQFAEYGDIALSELNGPSIEISQKNCCDHHEHEKNHHHLHTSSKVLAADLTMPESGFIKATNQGEGFYSIGWRFSADKVFNRKKLNDFLMGINNERMKAVFITDEGVWGYNFSAGQLVEKKLVHCDESRFESISTQSPNELEVMLLSCIVE